MQIKEKRTYELNCGCVVYMADQREVSGKIMKNMYRGKFIESCKDHRGFRTSWHKWRRDGTWYFKIHGKKEEEVREEFNIKKEIKQKNRP